MKPELSLKFSRLLAASAIGLLCIIALSMSLGLVSAQPPAATTAGTITVDTFADEYDTAPNSTCSLREAIRSINVITSFGGCTNPGLAADTIQLQAGTYNLTLGPASGSTASGSLYINANMTIQGASADQTIINNTVANDRVFRISIESEGAYVKLQGMTVQGGNTSSGGGIYASVAEFSAPYTALFVLHDVIVKNNQSTGSGGGLYLYLVNNAIFSDLTLENNQAVLNGGGLYVNEGANINVQRATVCSNTAGFGGGIYYQSQYINSRLTITNATIYSNAAQTSGGGLYVNFYYGHSNNATLNNVTIAGNRATTGTNIYNNQSAITLINTIVAHAAGSSAANNCAGDPTANISSGGHNIDSGNSCGLGGTGDKVNTDPTLAAALADNGGKTWTLALLGGSPAVNSGDDTVCPPTDQRGMTRLFPPCDIGAYEYVAWVYLPLMLRNN